MRPLHCTLAKLLRSPTLLEAQLGKHPQYERVDQLDEQRCGCMLGGERVEQEVRGRVTVGRGGWRARWEE